MRWNKHNNLTKFLDNSKISYVDVGASKDILERWKKYKKFLLIFAFEPIYEEYINLKSKLKNYKNIKLYNCALAEKNGLKKFYEVNGIYQSSFLKPNYSFVNQYPNSDRFKIKKTTNIKCKKFDSFNENFDFIKIDTQGFNYNVLIGGNKKIEKTLAIEVEVEFVKIYHNQKLFEDVKKYLESKNFIFIDCIGLRRWSNLKNNLFGRMIFGNALFIKSPDNIINDYKKYKKLIFILLIYNKLDLAYTFSKKLKFKDRIIIQKIVYKKKLIWFIPKVFFNLVCKFLRIFNKNIDYILFS